MSIIYCEFFDLIYSREWEELARGNEKKGEVEAFGIGEGGTRFRGIGSSSDQGEGKEMSTYLITTPQEYTSQGYKDDSDQKESW